MNFNLQESAIHKSVRQEKLPIFRYAKILSQIFLALLLLASFVLIMSFLGAFSSRQSFAFFAVSLSLYFLFFELYLFSEYKIKKPEISGKIEAAISDPNAYNLAEFLDFKAAKITEGSIRFCRKKKIKNNSTALLFASLSGREVEIIVTRLGISIAKLRNDLKNYLEKMPKDAAGVMYFSEDFETAIAEALNFCAKTKHTRIGEKEIFVGVAKSNVFFKKILMDCDLKEEDVENLVLWLDSAEDAYDRGRKFWTKENLAAKGSFGKGMASGYTVTLDQYSIDWRKIVSRWTYKEIIGHKKEIEETQMVLAKSDTANVLLVGEHGTGRKSIVQALAQKCYLAESLPELNNRRVVELDPVLMAAQIPDFEKLETALNQVFQEVLASGNVILVIDELEKFVGQKVQKAGAFDITAILSKYLPLPDFKLVCITSAEGLHTAVERDSSFVSFFRKIEVEEVSEAEATKIVQNYALTLEAQKKMLVLYPSVREIVNLTGKYIPSLPFPQKALDVLNETVIYVQTLKEKIVLPHHVAEVMSKKTEIPVGKMEVKEKEVLMNLENLIHQKIINQEEAVNGISIAMRRARAGIGPKNRPMGTFLFLGPTGVGKTETAKALAEIYFGKEDKMIRIDMSEFQAISDIPRLIGATSPVEMQGLLTTPVREAPFSLVLLDEIEKAHPDVLNLFLQVLDEGHITDGQGRKVIFTNTIIICTSNAAADMIFKEVETGKSINKDDLLESLFEKKIFRPEFVNRFDATIIFHPLTKNNLLKIAHLSLKSLQKSLKEKDIDFEITEELKEKIVELSYKPAFGAREMRRVIQDKVENAVAQALISEKIKKGDKIQIDPENFEILVTNAATA